MTDKPDNMRVWDRVWQTDAMYTKKFSRGGGFKGTATNATYLAREATRMFGPIGIGWGYSVIDERYQQGAGIDIVHVVRVRLWYVLDGVRGELEHYGQTDFVGTNKNGPYTDEEAPKKSLTDAVSKCLSQLGFAADVFLGFYDDSKYVEEREARSGESDRIIPSHGDHEGRARSQATDGEHLDSEAKPASTQKVLADGLVSHARANISDLASLREWIAGNKDAVNALTDTRGIVYVLKRVSEHACSVVDGMNKAGFKEEWKS